ncbi:MAG: SusC/RagA family TonB-linked outer membrane protein [Bacteroidota bacterium]
MKLTLLLTFTAILALQASDSYSQRAKITLQLSDATVAQVIDEIEANSEFKFIFKTRAVDLKRRVSINVHEENIYETLAAIFDNTRTTYEVDNRKVLLRKRKKVPGKRMSKPSSLTVKPKPPKPVPQPITLDVSGTVVDADSGEPLIGANVVEKGTNFGTVTDLNGEFSLSLKEDAPILVISYTGYKEEEVVVENQTFLEIKLTEDATGLNEITIIGYGSVVKKDVTGAVATIKREDFNIGEISSPEQLFQGKSPGVQISSDGGEPGGAVNVRIRGTSSVRSGNGPLYVVNGVPLSGSAISPSGANVGGNDLGAGNTTPKNPLSFLNPQDIESINILKDASATAIYGSRGANGVILITTKTGRPGETGLTYNTSVSTSTITRKLPLLSASEFIANGGPDLGSEVDWQDEIYRTAITQRHHFGYGGNSEDGNSNYALTFGIVDQEGIVKASGTKVYSGTINTNYKMLDNRLKITAFAAGSNIIDDNPQISNDAGVPGDLLGAAWRANPTQPIFNADGSFNQIGVSDLNPAAILAFSTDETNTFRILGNVSATYDFTSDFSYKFNFGVDRSNSERRSAVSRDLVAAISSQGGIVTNANTFNSSLLAEHTLNYNKELGKGSRFSALVGYSYQNFLARSNSFTTRNFQSSDLNVMLNNLAAATTAIGQAGEAISFAGKDELQSFFGRVNYSHNDKYLLTATVRADGSSKFGENNRYGYFPSFAFAWRLSQEDFIPAVFDDFKLRVGYGITGNQEFPGGSQLTIQRYDNNNALSAPRFANPDLKWESTTQINAGLDFAFFDWRLKGSIDIYRKNTTDLLLQLDSALPAPAPFYFGNLDAEVVNQGLEFGIEADIVRKQGFNWTSSFNIGLNQNEVTRIDRTILTGAISGPGLTGAFAQVITEGEPLYAYFMPEFSGFDDNGISIQSENRLVGKSPLPFYTFGFSNSLSIGNWRLSAFFSGQGGNFIYNNNANARFYRSAFAGGANVTSNVLDTNESSGNGNGVSTRFLEDGSFIRLQNASIGYNFNTDKIDFLQNCALSLVGQNLFLIDNYSGQDPEVNVDKSIGGVPSFGIDYSAYPRARTILLRLSATF